MASPPWTPRASLGLLTTGDLTTLDFEMARPTKPDKLVQFSVKITPDLKARILARSKAVGCTQADVLRTHLALEEVKPLGKVRPRARQPKELGKVSKAPADLMRQVGGMSSNLNQIARGVNTDLLAGASINRVTLLIELASIAEQLRVLSAHLRVNGV